MVKSTFTSQRPFDQRSLCINARRWPARHHDLVGVAVELDCLDHHTALDASTRSNSLFNCTRSHLPVFQPSTAGKPDRGNGVYRSGVERRADRRGRKHKTCCAVCEQITVGARPSSKGGSARPI
jgi:hypothetical protein